jgi:hypothetical protein
MPGSAQRSCVRCPCPRLQGVGGCLQLLGLEFRCCLASLEGLGRRADLGQQGSDGVLVVHLLHLSLPANKASGGLICLSAAHPLHFVCPSGRATGKIAFLGSVASEHLGLVLLATVEDRAHFWRGRGWRRPLAFLAHLRDAREDRCSGLLPVRAPSLLLTLRKFSFCSHSVVPTFYCCSVVTVQHFNTVFLLTLESSSRGIIPIFLILIIALIACESEVRLPCCAAARTCLPRALSLPACLPRFG